MALMLNKSKQSKVARKTYHNILEIIYRVARWSALNAVTKLQRFYDD